MASETSAEWLSAPALPVTVRTAPSGAAEESGVTVNVVRSPERTLDWPSAAETPSGRPETASDTRVGGPRATTRTEYAAGLPPTTAVAVEGETSRAKSPTTWSRSDAEWVVAPVATRRTTASLSRPASAATARRRVNDSPEVSVAGARAVTPPGRAGTVSESGCGGPCTVVVDTATSRTAPVDRVARLEGIQILNSGSLPEN